MFKILKVMQTSALSEGSRSFVGATWEVEKSVPCPAAKGSKPLSRLERIGFQRMDITRR